MSSAKIGTRGVAACALAMMFAAGCGSSSHDTFAENPGLRAVQAPAGGGRADADRAALARFVGTWTFEGWSIDQGGKRLPVSGRAAGAIENEHFVLIDIQATEGQLGGRSGRKSGSMLLASEPGAGLTLTAWGDASPSITRMTGQVGGNASGFVFNEVKTASGKKPVVMTVRFETDDRWTVELHASKGSDAKMLARYEFARSGN